MSTSQVTQQQDATASDVMTKTSEAVTSSIGASVAAAFSGGGSIGASSKKTKTTTTTERAPAQQSSGGAMSKAEADRRYEENIEDEYAKREGGA